MSYNLKKKKIILINRKKNHLKIFFIMIFFSQPVARKILVFPKKSQLGFKIGDYNRELKAH